MRMPSAVVVLALALPCAGATRGRLLLSQPTAGRQQITVTAAEPGTRLFVTDGIRPLGAILTDRHGMARLPISALSAGHHTLRAVKWGTGEITAEPLTVDMASTPVHSFASAVIHQTGIRAEFMTAGDMSGDGSRDLILASGSTIRILHAEDGSLGAVLALDGFAPTAVAVLDADGDGLNDVAVTGRDGRVAMLLNRRGGSWARAQFYTAGAHPSAIATADFNGDGIPDLAIANEDSNDVSLLFGAGDGTFKTAVAIPTGYAPQSILVEDFDGDGIADLVTANFASNDISLLAGDGRGGFAPPRNFAAGNGPAKLVTGDFNGDGSLDLVVLDRISRSASVLLNDGRGGFVRQGSFRATGLSEAEGSSDLLVQIDDELRFRPGLGDGSFGDGYVLASVQSSSLFLVSDLTRDGMPDTLVIDPNGEMRLFAGLGIADSTSIRHRPVGEVNQRRLEPLGNSATSTVLRTSVASIPYGQPVTLTATVSPSNAIGTVTFFDGTVLLGTRSVSNGQASFSTAMLAAGTRILKAVYSGNATFAASTSGTVSQTITSTPNIGFQPLISYPTGTAPYAVAIADFNGDGRADLAIANSGGYPGYNGSVSVYFGNGNGTFRPAVTYLTGVGAAFVAAGDLNGDGAPELIVVNWGGTISVFGNKGDGTFFSPSTYSVGRNPYSLAIADFNGDGYGDVVVANNTDNNLTLLLGSSTGALSTTAAIPAGNLPQAVTAADFNGDGIADVAIANSGGISILLGNGNATFQSAMNYAAGTTPYSIAAADFNGDGRTDLAVANLDSGNITVLLGKGDGGFSTTLTYATGLNPEYVATGDFNGDGIPDLVVANFGSSLGSGGSVSVLTGTRSGTFQNAVNYAAGKTPFFVAVGNLNGDALPDLAVVDLMGNSVGVLLGKSAVLAPSQLKFTLAPTNVTLGSSFTAAVQVQDANGVFISNSSATVTLSSTPAGISTSISAVNGMATFNGLIFSSPGSYTMTASSGGLAPASYNLTIAAPPSFTVSGQVSASGIGVSNATVRVIGTMTTSTTTDANGNFNISLYAGGSYSLAAARQGYSFSSPVTLSNLSANQTVNFSGTSMTGLQFYPVTPCRIADTRTIAGFTGQFGPPSLAAGTTRTFAVAASPCGIPANAGAYALNFTAIPQGPLGLMTAWPTGQPMPNTSTLSSYTGVVTANGTIIPAGTGGAISIFVNNTTDLVFDITGYFAPPQTSGLQFYPVAPCRIADTRAAAGFPAPFGPPAMSPGVTRSFPVTASSCGIPANAAAYSLNFTAIPPGSLGVMTTWPTGRPMPNASTLNSYAGLVVANAAIVPAGDNGAINVFVNNATDLVFDINGYFAPPSTGLNFYPVLPCRVADTRAVAGFPAPFGPSSLVPGVERSFPVTSSVCQIPSTAGAYSLNFTAVPPGPLGLLTTWPTGTPRPNASTLNSYNGTVVSNAAIVPAGDGGAISVFTNSPTDVVFDINGYFAK